MTQTIYAKFPNAIQCEQAAGALLDFGVRKEDIALVARETTREEATIASERSQERRNIAQLGYRGGEARAATVLDRPMPDYAPTVLDSGFNNPQSHGFPVLEDQTHDADLDGLDDTSKGYIVTSARTVETIDDGPGIDDAAKDGISVTTPADAAAGAVSGAGWGLGIGILAGLACLTIPGVGLVLGGGALATAIAGAIGVTAAGAAAGGVVGYLKDQGMPDHIATDYNSTLTEGGAILAVTTPSGSIEATEAAAILRKYGATRVDVY